MTDQSSDASLIDSQATAGPSASPSDAAKFSQPASVSHPVPERVRKAPPRRKLLFGLLGIVALAALLLLGIPWVEDIFSTVSTDDAYVNGHVTFVAPRVTGQISKVLVDDNNRVRKGDLLAVLDTEPYLVAVSQKQAAVNTADADLQAAKASARGIEAQAMGQRWNLQRAVEGVDSQVALLHARVAAIAKSRAAVVLAQIEFDRARQLVTRADVSRETLDQRQAELTTAGAELLQAFAEAYQIRVSLGLQAQPAGDGNLGQVPPDLDETFSSVLEAQAQLIQSAAQLGVAHSFEQGPKAMLDQFYRLGDVDTTFAHFAANAPAVKQAEAKLAVAKRDLAQAELNLRYCNIVAEIDGVITRRNVNPGNNVQVGQNLMALRSVTEVWVDANFKETQLRDLRIGQPVDLHVDMYGSKRIFKGRVSGFTMGTGSTLALLPAENATGNFIKVVQRLPVRIDLIDYDAEQTPLFIGTSIVPTVYINSLPAGPNAGKLLQAETISPPRPSQPDSASASRQ